MNNKFLWEDLNLSSSCTIEEVNKAYKKIKNKTENVTLAWKVLSDKYYADVYKTYKNMKYVYDAGFFVDKYTTEKKDFYNLNLLTTPVGKIINNLSKSDKMPVVLLSTGGFAPLHEGHFLMMDKAKEELEKQGYNVVGGYFSPSHDSYFHTKPYSNFSAYDRVAICQKSVKDSNWLMIDPWESLYTKTYLNFTDVIDRLEKYLQKHISKKIKVAYVFGADNTAFMYCFKNMGIGVCLERDGHSKGFNKIKNELQKSTNIFIENKSILSSYTSRTIRQNANYTHQINSDEIIGKYVIRDEGIVPFKKFLQFTNEQRLENLTNQFIKNLKNEMYLAFDKKIQVAALNLQEQLNMAKLDLKGKNTISLDTYYKGTYNIQTSRLFEVSDPQYKYLDLCGRKNNNFEKQIEKIQKGNYILVDDDSATGKTINDVILKLPRDVKIDKIYLLSKLLKHKIFDIVDLRDFIIGGANGGLLVRLPNGKSARAPYLIPYVSLKSRASIPPINEFYFSIKLWELNKWYFENLSKDITLKNTEQGFKNLMKYVGFSEETSLVQICDWHIKKIKEAIDE